LMGHRADLDMVAKRKLPVLSGNVSWLFSHFTDWAVQANMYFIQGINCGTFRCSYFTIVSLQHNFLYYLSWKRNLDINFTIPAVGLLDFIAWTYQTFTVGMDVKAWAFFTCFNIATLQNKVPPYNVLLAENIL
jgi:hypothetical protein